MPRYRRQRQAKGSACAEIEEQQAAGTFKRKIGLKSNLVAEPSSSSGIITPETFPESAQKRRTSPIKMKHLKVSDCLGNIQHPMTSLPESVLLSRTSPIKIKHLKVSDCHGNIQHPMTSSPAAEDQQSGSGSFGKSTAFKVYQFLDLSGDSHNDPKSPVKKVKDQIYAPRMYNYLSSSSKESYDLGQASASSEHYRPVKKSVAVDNVLSNFWNVSIASPNLPSPIPKPSLYSIEEDKENQVFLSTEDFGQPSSSSRPFPTTPPPVHVSSLENTYPCSPPLSEYDAQSDFSYWNTQGNNNANGRRGESYNQPLLSPEYFVDRYPFGQFNCQESSQEYSQSQQQKTDIVVLMQELSLKYGSRDQEESRSSYSFQQEDQGQQDLDFCVFCKKNSMHATFYRSHTLRDKRGLCQCPVLRVYVCPLCKGTGDNAHTLKYCPRNCVTRGDPITAGLPPGKVTNWRNMAEELFSRK